MRELTEREKDIIQTFAECNMKSMATAQALYLHRNTVVYHLEKIERETGLNPLNFYDLIKLLKECEGANEKLQ